jgi:hypothetical protein
VSTQKQVKSASDPFLGTCGESATAGQHRFIPAFRCETSGRVELARFPNGSIAPMHLIIALPREWASQTDHKGGVVCLKDSITAGFWRDARFFTRAEAKASDVPQSLAC